MEKEDKRDGKTGESKTIANSLQERSSGTESGGSNEATAVVVDNNTDGDIGDRNNGLADDQSLGVVARVSHLSSDGEETRSTGIRENESRASSNGLSEAWVSDKVVVGLPVAVLGSEGRSVLNTNSDGDGEDGGDDADNADPGEPRNAAESLDTGKDETDNGSDDDEDGGAGTVEGEGVESDRDTEHGGTADEDPV